MKKYINFLENELNNQDMKKKKKKIVNVNKFR